MEKYGITDNDLKTSEELGEEERKKREEAEQIIVWRMDVDPSGGHGRARIAAFGAVVNAMGGKYTYRSRSYYADMEIFAPASVIESMKIFFPIMTLQMETLSKQYSRERANKYRKTSGYPIDPKDSQRSRRGFMMGFGEGIARRTRELRQENIVQDYAEKGESSQYALVVMTRQDRVRAYYDNYYKDVKMGNGTKLDYDMNGYMQGKRAGAAFASPKLDYKNQPSIGR